MTRSLTEANKCERYVQESRKPPVERSLCTIGYILWAAAVIAVSALGSGLGGVFSRRGNIWESIFPPSEDIIAFMCGYFHLMWKDGLGGKVTGVSRKEPMDSFLQLYNLLS